MLSRYEHNGVVWIDLESPTQKEVASVAVEFDLDTFVAEELLAPSARPWVEKRERYIYLILHFPALRHSHLTNEQEVDFVIGKDFIITTRYDTVDPLHKFSKVFEVNSLLDKNHLSEHAGFLFYYMLKNLYKAIDFELDFIRKDLTMIEEHIFSGHEVDMVETISKSSRSLLNLRQTIEPHRDVLQDLHQSAGDFFGETFAPYLKSLANDYYRVHNHVMRNTESLHELRETNNSMLTTKQNETMRVLTLMALLTFPLALFVAIFDVDTVSNPITDVKNGFWVLVGAVIGIGGLMLWYFKHKKWL